ncbi:2-oxoglutarate and iron-dependent oxygenase domain-containing protein 2 isoform X2 [Bombina bombina]|uniref:2-oxoglutarate and iron-dependent oxygenase domain-containing protein 2 isoform X2 n=1 Tax=Bombina bombina TaxID=8345 RepID=UPI00235B1AC0|nr:2-oxoglutarate and iron-dependent oxygenase domain-containing protein 2 isoform X2 [Bombina bombina]
MATRPSYSCACFFTDNIFIEQYQVHVRFTDEPQFRRDYERVQKEVLRRKNLGKESLWRRAEISRLYNPMYPKIYVLKEEFLAAELLETVRFCKSSHADLEGLLKQLQPVLGKRIFRLPVFCPQFCRKLVEELEHFEKSDLPKGRPNTMNNYGVLLNELGFDDTFIRPLRERYLQPLSALLYPDWGGGALDSHKAFVVKYSTQEDLDLSSHYDNAEVTLNISLGKDFTEGNLYFSDMRQVPANERRYIEVEHMIGQGIFHRGQHVHGALPVASGERWNLIIWMRASAVRNELCPMCDREPQLVKILGDGDGFTKPEQHRVETVDVCSVI